MPNIELANDKCILFCTSKNHDYYQVENPSDGYQSLSIPSLGTITLMPYEIGTIHTSNCRKDLTDQQFLKILETLCPLSRVKLTNQQQMDDTLKKHGLIGLGHHINSNSDKLKLTIFHSKTLHIEVPFNDEFCIINFKEEDYNTMPAKLKQALNDKALNDKD